MWAEHETAHLVSKAAECPFCGATFQQRALTYFKHVSTHLQEVSLSVLPHPTDEDDGFNSESSDDSDNEEHISSLEQKGPQLQPEPAQILSRLGVAGPSEQGQIQTTAASAQVASNNSDDVDLDSIIDRLLEVRGSRPGKQVQLLTVEIRYLCTKAREIFVSQPILLELECPLKV